MKSIKSFFFILSFILLIELIQTESGNNTTIPNSNTPNIPNVAGVTNNTGNNILNYGKPSKAFTAVLMVYLGLIVIGSILVLILIKPKLN